jgi:hypothetical protein
MAEPNPYTALLSQASCLAQSYLDGIRERFVGVDEEARIGMRRLGGDLTEAGEDPHDVLRLLHEAGSPATMASMGGRFFGGVVGASLPVAVAAPWLRRDTCCWPVAAGTSSEMGSSGPHRSRS